ncbi:YceI family protein, partial [Escherichia coli]|nr:YceI family protein [Escherichia coli]
DRNRSHWSTSKTPSYTKSVSWQHHLNGVTKPVTLEAKLIGQGDDPWGGKRAGFEAEGKIKLKDFNIKTDLGPASQDVDLIISVEGVQQK